MLFIHRPDNFKPKFGVSSCFVLHKGKFLCLLRQDNKVEGNKWGVPAGKMEHSETTLITIRRELKEETGLVIPENKFKYFKVVYVKYPEFDYDYHMYSVELDTEPIIQLDYSENKEYKWFTPQESLTLDLIRDEDTCIKLFFGRD